MSQQNEQGAPMNLGFGITTETRSDSYVPILTAKKVENNPQFPNNWAFPIARLVNVVFNPKQETKNGDRIIMDFIFKDPEGRQYTHREWEQDPNDEKYSDKINGVNSRVKHIYVQTIGDFPTTGLGVGAKSFSEYYKAIVDAFNGVVVIEGESTKKVYYTNQCYIKLVYYKNKLGFTLSPNFLERVVQGKPCITLSIGAKEKVEPNRNSAPTGGGIPGVANGSAMPGADALPDFNGGFN
jgi:hypothetical protein